MTSNPDIPPSIPGSDQPPVAGKSSTARSGLVAIFVAAILAVVFAGDSISRTADEMPEGTLRSVVSAVGKPAGAVAEALPFAAAADSVQGWFAPDETPRAASTARPAPPGTPATPVAAGAAIGPGDFDRRAVQDATPLPSISSVLVTGDSMSMPLDIELARALAPAGVDVIRDPRIGSGISKVAPVDWTELAPEQIAEDPVDVVVMLLGANEGFPLGPSGEHACCTADWAADYATRVDQIARAYLDGGARLIWLMLPAPRDPRRQPISRAVNGAVRVALGRLGMRATVLATDELFTPGGRYRSAMPVDGQQAIVRDEDGIHLNETGARIASDLVQRELRRLYRVN